MDVLWYGHDTHMGQYCFGQLVQQEDPYLLPGGRHSTVFIMHTWVCEKGMCKRPYQDSVEVFATTHNLGEGMVFIFMRHVGYPALKNIMLTLEDQATNVTRKVVIGTTGELAHCAKTIIQDARQAMA